MCELDIASALLDAGNTDSARGEAAKLLEKNVKHAEAHCLIVLSYLREEEIKLAKDAALYALSELPDNPEVQLVFIVVLLANRELDNANKALQRFRKDWPNAVDRYLSVAIPFALKSGNYIAAHRYIDEAEQTGGAGELFQAMRCRVLRAQGRFISAYRLSGRCLAEGYRLPEFLVTRAISAFRIGLIHEAIRAARTAAKEIPNEASNIREIVGASYLLCFPPFAVGQMFISPVVSFVMGAPAARFVGFPFIIMVVLPVAILVGEGMYTLGGENAVLAFFGLAFGWAIYSAYFFQIFLARRKMTKPSVVLPNY